MSDLPVYEIKLPPRVTEMLMSVLEMAEKNQVMTILWWCRVSMEREWISYDFMAGKEIKDFGQISETPLMALEALGLLKVFYRNEKEQEGTILLTNLAYEWARYNRKSKIGKFFYRYWPGWKYVGQGIVGALITIIPVLWVVLELLYYWGFLQKKP